MSDNRFPSILDCLLRPRTVITLYQRRRKLFAEYKKQVNNLLGLYEFKIERLENEIIRLGGTIDDD